MRSPRSLLLAAALLASVAGCGDDSKDNGPTPIPYADDGKIQVMTRNLYLGADLQPIIDAGTNTGALLSATTAAWAQVQGNDFNARAAKIADEILAAKPDLVGLQECTLWRTQTPSDVQQNPAPNATTVAYDYLAALRSELAKRGLSYDPVEVLELFDVEVPVVSAGAAQDVRLTDRQVILARTGVTVRNPRGQVFTTLLPLPVAGSTLDVKRGWTSVEATVGGQDFTFFNTHLEAFNDQVRDVQAAELGAVLAQSSGRTILVGDLNSTPGTGGHLVATTAGFTDVWAAVNPGQDGFTCCFPPDLHQGGSLTERIDHVLAKGLSAQAAPQISIVGNTAADKTASGLWPSDHAGVTATMNP